MHYDAARFKQMSSQEPAVGPLPKRKISRARRNRRRAHDALKQPRLVRCSECNEFRLAHRVCPKCGSYRGEQFLPPKDK